jgi:hypothetical protein
VGARLRSERRAITVVCAASVVAGIIQPHVIPTNLRDPFAAEVATRAAWIAGPVFFGSFLGILMAIVQRGAGRLRELELCEQSAPLYGRQLARATAIVPCIVATAAAFAYWVAQFVTGLAAPPAFFILALAAVNASTLVALSATLRRGFSRYLYVTLAGFVAAISFLLAVYADTVPFRPSVGSPHYPDVLGIAFELIFCASIGFVALRQYGEALARYDPVP